MGKPDEVKKVELWDSQYYGSSKNEPCIVIGFDLETGAAWLMDTLGALAEVNADNTDQKFYFPGILEPLAGVAAQIYENISE